MVLVTVYLDIHTTVVLCRLMSYNYVSTQVLFYRPDPVSCSLKKGASEGAARSKDESARMDQCLSRNLLSTLHKFSYLLTAPSRSSGLLSHGSGISETTDT